MSNLGISILLILLVSMIITVAKDLPGLDYLSTGFDALKMVNLNEESSSSDKLKFRLFKLDDRSGQPYTMDADGKEQTFTTSRYIQATTINMKTKVSIETLSSSYQDFRRRYFIEDI